MFEFTCNVCGSRCRIASKADIGRETPNCEICGSTVRFRWMVHALSVELFGRSIPLPVFPERKSVTGAGMSEWARIADGLSSKFTFKNTFYHAEPKLDILHPAPADLGAYDFVISSEVFEHVPPPAQPAFNNLSRILRPGGFTIFSVPWVPDGHTREHYPNLHEWKIIERDNRRVLINRTREGALEEFHNPVFHDGEGQVLEMRLFSQNDLVAHFKNAGFEQVEIAAVEADLEYGITWEPWSRGLVARKRRSRRATLLEAIRRLTR
jgi:SAM-dependent methyltransferase